MNEIQEQITGRDYTFIIDKSSSMNTRDCPGNKTRWDAAREGAEAFAQRACDLDPDGITVYTFGSEHKRFDNVNQEKVRQIFAEQSPFGSTNLAGVLDDALKDWAQRKAAGKLKKGDTIVVLTDGVPDDEDAVSRVIVNATKKMDKDEELAILALQIGKDGGASEFLTRLDDNLEKEGAKFDVVDTKTYAQVESIGMDAALQAAIND